MSQLIEHLRSFNRKERFILLREALGTDALGDDFRTRLGDLIGTTVPADAFVAMDYHLDWLQMALYLAGTPSPPQPIPNDDELVVGNQEDADLIVAFEGDSTTHVVLVEAKVETGWTNGQLKSKAERLSRIFAEGRPGAHLVTPCYVLASPEPPPPGISTAGWPSWDEPRRRAALDGARTATRAQEADALHRAGGDVASGRLRSHRFVERHRLGDVERHRSARDRARRPGRKPCDSAGFVLWTAGRCNKRASGDRYAVAGEVHCGRTPRSGPESDGGGVEADESVAGVRPQYLLTPGGALHAPAIFVSRKVCLPVEGEGRARLTRRGAAPSMPHAHIRHDAKLHPRHTQAGIPPAGAPARGVWVPFPRLRARSAYRPSTRPSHRGRQPARRSRGGRGRGVRG